MVREETSNELKDDVECFLAMDLVPSHWMEVKFFSKARMKGRGGASNRMTCWKH